MNTRSHIECACGQRVVSRDVLTTGYMLHTGTQVSVLIKFRCPRCRKLGRELISRDRWDWSVLDEASQEVGVEERKRFEEMGPIQAEESIDFHFLLEQTDRLVETSP